MGSIIKYGIGVLLVVLLLGYCSKNSKEPSKPITDIAAPAIVLTPKEHMEKAQEIYKEVSSKKKVEDINSAKIEELYGHLNYITSENEDYAESLKIRENLVPIQKKIDAYMMKVAEKLQMSQREILAQQFEQIFLDQGMDIYVTIKGKNKDILNMKYILCSRPFIHQFNKEEKLLVGLSKGGFKRIQCETGYGEKWWLDL